MDMQPRRRGSLLKCSHPVWPIEIPAELTFSTYGITNRTSTRMIGFICPEYRSMEIQDGQHYSGLDFTEVGCKNTVDKPCTMAPRSTWEQWSTAERTFIVRVNNGDQPSWHCVQVKDNEDTRRAFFEAVKSGSFLADKSEFGECLVSGEGKDPPEDVKKKLIREYNIKYDFMA